MLITGREQIAQRMGLSWPTVKKLYLREGLPLVRLGLKWALDTEQLQEWLSRKRRQAA
jgi:excisionase family DNA binding protein